MLANILMCVLSRAGLFRVWLHVDTQSSDCSGADFWIRDMGFIFWWGKVLITESESQIDVVWQVGKSLAAAFCGLYPCPWCQAHSTHYLFFCVQGMCLNLASWYVQQ